MNIRKVRGKLNHWAAEAMRGEEEARCQGDHRLEAMYDSLFRQLDSASDTLLCIQQHEQESHG